MTPAPRFCQLCGAALRLQMMGGLPRHACPQPACGWVHWDNPVPVVAAVVELDGHVLLARNQAWPEGKFGLVTGFLERGESPEAAVVREVKEETDLDAGAPSLLGVYPFERMNQVIIAYALEARGKVRLNEELAEYRLIVPEQLRPWDFGTGLALAEWLRRRLTGDSAGL